MSADKVSDISGTMSSRIVIINLFSAFPQKNLPVFSTAFPLFASLPISYAIMNSRELDSDGFDSSPPVYLEPISHLPIE